MELNIPSSNILGQVWGCCWWK